MSCRQIATDNPVNRVARPRAMAYYRQSVQEQNHSIPVQREQIHAWAEKNGVEIIEEFSDPDKSEQTAPGA